MPDSNQPNIQAELPEEGSPKSAPANLKRRDTIRIQLPLRPPSPPPPTIPALSPDPLQPESVPVLPRTIPASSDPANEIAQVGVVTELKKETARIPLVPKPPSRPLPGIDMKKTQPLVAMPEATAGSAPILVAPTERITALPMPLCWTLLGISAAIVIIEIWMYFS